MSAGAAVAGGLPAAGDLPAAAAEARQRNAPLLVMFSSDECPYCDVVKKEYLIPLVEDPAERERVLVRVVNLGHQTPLVDFGGHPSTHTEFARSQGVDFVPTLRFFDATGRTLVPDMVGLTLEDFYSWYLTAAIDEAQAKLAKLTD